MTIKKTKINEEDLFEYIGENDACIVLRENGEIDLLLPEFDQTKAVPELVETAMAAVKELRDMALIKEQSKATIH